MLEAYDAPLINMTEISRYLVVGTRERLRR